MKLEWRARVLEKVLGQVFRTRLQTSGSQPMLRQLISIALLRPWIHLFRKLVITIISMLMALVYGALHMIFGAFLMIDRQHRGLSPYEGGLALLGIFTVIRLIRSNAWYKGTETEALTVNKLVAAPETYLPLGIFIARLIKLASPF